VIGPVRLVVMNGWSPAEALRARPKRSPTVTMWSVDPPA